jgi:hypothetical protein
VGFFSRFHFPNKEGQQKMNAVPAPPEWYKRERIFVRSIGTWAYVDECYTPMQIEQAVVWTCRNASLLAVDGFSQSHHGFPQAKGPAQVRF